MHFLSPNQQCQCTGGSTIGTVKFGEIITLIKYNTTDWRNFFPKYTCRPKKMRLLHFIVHIFKCLNQCAQFWHTSMSLDPKHSYWVCFLINFVTEWHQPAINDDLIFLWRIKQNGLLGPTDQWTSPNIVRNRRNKHYIKNVLDDIWGWVPEGRLAIKD